MNKKIGNEKFDKFFENKVRREEKRRAKKEATKIHNIDQYYKKHEKLVDKEIERINRKPQKIILLITLELIFIYFYTYLIDKYPQIKEFVLNLNPF